MSKLHSLLIPLTLGLAACGGSGAPGPDPAQTAFFGSQPEFGAAAPAGSEQVTPAQFMDAVKNGGKVITAQALEGEKAAQERQDAQDDADARASIGQSPEFSALLESEGRYFGRGRPPLMWDLILKTRESTV